MQAKVISALRQQMRPPGPVLDIHVHPLHCFGPYPVADLDADATWLIGAARRAGVDKMAIFSLHPDCPRSPTPQQCRQANDYVLRMRDRNPEVFLPFCYVNPAHPQEATDEIERCIARERMVGIKLWVARRATDPGLEPIMAAAAEWGVPVLQHAWRKTTGNLVGESTPAEVAQLAAAHPQVPIIMAHLNGCNPRGLEAVVPQANVFVDVSGGDPESGMVEWAVERLGGHRVLYGSDAPIRHFAVCLAKVVGAQLPLATKRAILWGNAANLLPPWAGVEPAAEGES